MDEAVGQELKPIDQVCYFAEIYCALLIFLEDVAHGGWDMPLNLSPGNGSTLLQSETHFANNFTPPPSTSGDLPNTVKSHDSLSTSPGRGNVTSVRNANLIRQADGRVGKIRARTQRAGAKLTSQIGVQGASRENLEASAQQNPARGNTGQSMAPPPRPQVSGRVIRNMQVVEEGQHAIPQVRRIPVGTPQRSPRPIHSPAAQRTMKEKVAQILRMPGARELVLEDLRKKEERGKLQASGEDPMRDEAQPCTMTNWQQNGIEGMNDELAKLIAAVQSDSHAKAQLPHLPTANVLKSCPPTTSAVDYDDISELFPTDIFHTGEARAECDRYNNWARYLGEGIFATRYDPKGHEWDEKLFHGGLNTDDTSMLLKQQPPPRTLVAPAGDKPGHLRFVHNQYTEEEPVYCYDKDGLPLEEDLFSPDHSLPGSWAQKDMAYLSITGIQSELTYAADYASRVEQKNFSLFPYLVRPGEDTKMRQIRAYAEMEGNDRVTQPRVPPPVPVVPARPRRVQPSRKTTLKSNKADGDRNHVLGEPKMEDPDTDMTPPPAYGLTTMWPDGERIRLCNRCFLNLPIEAFRTSSTECASCVEYIEDFHEVPLPLDSD